MILSKYDYLTAMGIQTWQERYSSVAVQPEFCTKEQADLMVICDATEVFVGEVEQLLQKMLQAIGLDRSSIYLTDGLNESLVEQMALVRPKVILVFGEVAGQRLLGLTLLLEELRGKCHLYGGIPLVVSYHPAHLLVNPQDKRKAWGDLLLVQQRFRG